MPCGMLRAVKLYLNLLDASATQLVPQCTPEVQNLSMAMSLLRSRGSVELDNFCPGT